VLDIIEAIDGPIALARCCAPGESPEEHGCTHSPRCRIQNAMRLMHSGVLEILRNVTVDDLADRENRATPPTVPIRIDGSNEHTPDAQRTGSRTLTHDLTPDHGGR
jgi:DNA-binding IscR family transcriptional regulator